MEINKIYCESNLETMAKMPDNFVDLVVTSPPYDGLRKYNRFSFPFEDIASELYRILKVGGTLVWIVGDETKDGTESGTSFIQALHFKNIVGFKLHDTMIYHRHGRFPMASRYWQNFEYMFVWSKGNPNTFNGLREPREYTDNRTKKAFGRNKDNSVDLGYSSKDETRLKRNVWRYFAGGGANDKIASQHPAIFPEQLANDHIISWSNENDLIYDPFMGSGTTAKMAILNNRKYIGSEISKDYCKIIETRIKECGGLFLNSFQTELSNEAGT